MTAYTTVSLIRHGEVLNPNNIVYGRLSGYRLSARGQKQVYAAGSALKSAPVRAILSSPLLRARQTAQAIRVFHPHLTVRLSYSLLEVYTCWQGHSMAEADSRGGDVYTGAPSCFEQPIDIVKRMWTFLKRIRRQYRGKHVVAVSHGDPIAFLLLWLKDADLSPTNKTRLTAVGIPDQYPALASITTLSFRGPATGERPHIKYLKPHDDGCQV
jgi:broad specificity phosphatase PhoE